ncbi:MULTISPECIES: DUF6518 family protein [unclassified Streptomyces]|uniref:DUF6518 family protein n=1 Tax=unclassified Streptomyces TaxID=2593676 RepID=UPI00307839C6
MSSPTLVRSTLAPTASGVAPLACTSAAGLALGVLTNLLQGWLPWPWSQLANSGGVWAVVAFAAGALLVVRTDHRLRLALAGALAEGGLVAGYYGYAEFGRGGMGSLVFPLVWLGMACVSGPLFALAGAWWRRGARFGRRVAGLGALGGLFGSEALHTWLANDYRGQALVCAAVAVAAPLLMARTMKERWSSLAATVIASPLAYGLVYLPLDSVSG